MQDFVPSSLPPAPASPLPLLLSAEWPLAVWVSSWLSFYKEFKEWTMGQEDEIVLHN